MWFLAWGSQIVDAHSNLGLTMALYACSFTFTELIFNLLRVDVLVPLKIILDCDTYYFDDFTFSKI